MELEGSLQHSQVPTTFQSVPFPFFILCISQLGHRTRPGHCNMQNWRFSSDWSCMCVSWSLSYSTLFQSDLLPSLQRLYSTHTSALCSWVPWEHEALVWVGYKLLQRGNNLPCGVYYCKFLDFFFQFGENIQWITDGFALGRMCARCVDIDHFCTTAPWV